MRNGDDTNRSQGESTSAADRKAEVDPARSPASDYGAGDSGRPAEAEGTTIAAEDFTTAGREALASTRAAGTRCADVQEGAEEKATRRTATDGWIGIGRGIDHLGTLLRPAEHCRWQRITSAAASNEHSISRIKLGEKLPDTPPAKREADAKEQEA
jgi:hypothetical protein